VEGIVMNVMTSAHCPGNPAEPDGLDASCEFAAIPMMASEILETFGVPPRFARQQRFYS